MTEQFLHYIWFNKLFLPQQCTTDGQRVDIIDVGQLNTDAGADVFNAKIKIGDTLWAGNVEFHIRASDWQRHGHHTDKAYLAVILHVILEDDGQAFRSNQTAVPQIIIAYPKGVESKYEHLNIGFIACADKMLQSSKINIDKTLSLLLEERLENRCVAIEHKLSNNANDWEEAFYITTARSFGFGTNADTFEAMAQRIPQKILAKHKDNLPQIEALLFGTGGFLEKSIDDPYYELLQREYSFLQQKYRLNPIDLSMWKQFRIRPNNFPTVRIAQFANLIYRSSRLFSKIMEHKSYSQLVEFYRCTTSEYWDTHYNFGVQTEKRYKRMNKSSIDSILINSVVPFFYAYGKRFGLSEYVEIAYELLRSMPAEANSVTKGFAELGIKCSNAFDSQAIKELKSRYCDTKSCFICKNKFGLW